MVIFKEVSAISHLVAGLQNKGLRCGFVPTMGALHEGHISLLRTAAGQTDKTICSIFVNPTQFNNQSDFDKYPQTIESDILQLEKAGCDILFLPDVHEMYPGGLSPTVNYPLGELETLLEGHYRPGHFQGVCQVVHRLLDIIHPDILFLGQKDFQQCKVIEKLIQLIGNKTRLVICPTKREPDGLAMSSRNLRLDSHQRVKATAIYRVLSQVIHQIKPGDTTQLTLDAGNQLRSEGFNVDYLEIADYNTLAPIRNWDGKSPAVALVAAYLGEIRLIDNLTFGRITE